MHCTPSSFRPSEARAGIQSSGDCNDCLDSSLRGNDRFWREQKTADVPSTAEPHRHLERVGTQIAQMGTDRPVEARLLSAVTAVKGRSTVRKTDLLLVVLVVFHWLFEARARIQTVRSISVPRCLCGFLRSHNHRLTESLRYFLISCRILASASLSRPFKPSISASVGAISSGPQATG
jgi:hypothetical protein